MRMVRKKMGKCGATEARNDLLDTRYFIISSEDDYNAAKEGLADGDNKIFYNRSTFEIFPADSSQSRRVINLSELSNGVVQRFENFNGKTQKYYMISLNQQEHQIPKTVDKIQELAKNRDVYVRHCLYTKRSDYFFQNHSDKDKLNAKKVHNGKFKYMIDHIVDELNHEDFVDKSLEKEVEKRISNAKKRKEKIKIDYEKKIQKNSRLAQAVEGFVELCELYFASGVKALSFNEFKTVTEVSLSPLRHKIAKNKNDQSEMISVYSKLIITPDFLKQKRSEIIKIFENSLYLNSLFAISDRQCVNYSYNFTIYDNNKAKHGVLFLDDVPISLKNELPSNFYLVETSKGNCHCHIFLDKMLTSEERAEAIEKLKIKYRGSCDPAAYDNQGRRIPGFLNRKAKYLERCNYRSPNSSNGYMYKVSRADLLLPVIATAGFGCVPEPLLAADIFKMPSAQKLQTTQLNHSNQKKLSDEEVYDRYKKRTKSKTAKSFRINHKTNNQYEKRGDKSILPVPDSSCISDIYNKMVAAGNGLLSGHISFVMHIMIYDLSEAEIENYLRQNHNPEAAVEYNGAALDKYYADTVQTGLRFLRESEPGHPRFHSNFNKIGNTYSNSESNFNF